MARHSFGIQGINSREGCSQARPLQREKARRLCRVYLVRLTWLRVVLGCGLPGCHLVTHRWAAGLEARLSAQLALRPLGRYCCHDAPRVGCQAQLALQRCRLLSCHWRAARLRVAGPPLLARLRGFTASACARGSAVAARYCPAAATSRAAPRSPRKSNSRTSSATAGM